MTTTDTSIYQNAGITSASSLTTTKETGVSTIDQAGFLKLMTAQLQYQDPFQPTDNNQMVQQMATFTSLENQNTQNTTLKSIADSLSGTRLSDAASWIGKSMLVKSTTATSDREGAYAGELTLTEDTSDVQVDLINSSTGETVKTLDLGAQKAGAATFYWDGKDADGNLVSDGSALQVQLRGGKASSIATWATIAAVQSPASGSDAKLITPLGNYSPTDALRLG